MRLYYALLIILVGIAFGAGSLFLSVSGQSRKTAIALPDIGSVEQDFLNGRRASEQLNLHQLFPQDGSKELLSPGSLLPSSHLYKLDAIRALYSYAIHCRFEKPVSVGSELKKALHWEQFLCNQRSSLPKDFFETPPYIHPSGKSYAKLALQSGRKLMVPSTAFHALERDTPLLLDLSKSGLKGLARLDRLVIGRHKVFLLKSTGPHQETARLYDVYPKSDWDSFLSKFSLATTSLDHSSGSLNCFAMDGEVCWQYNLDSAFRRISLVQFGILIASLALIGGVSLLIIRKIRQDRLQEERRRFVLQTLTHELRTPVASMRVGLELLKERLEDFPASAQDDLLRVDSDVQRLHRLAERSRTYLSAHPDKHQLLQLTPERVELEPFLRDMLAPFDATMIFEAAPLHLLADRHWLEICLKNLVENALHHGAPPVSVRVARLDDKARITVQDNGPGIVRPLHDVCEAFSKSRSSRGFGLGLNITKTVVREMGGKLLYLPNPTRFIIELEVLS